jgi:hypothetical protein
MTEIFDTIAVTAMPAGDDHDDVVGLDRWRGGFKIGNGDELPLLLGDGEHDAGSKETLERNIADAWSALNEMKRRVHMRAAMHDHADACSHDAVLGMGAGTVELDLLVARQRGNAVAPFVTELVKHEPGLGLRHTGHHDLPAAPADFIARRPTCKPCGKS